MPHPDDDGRPFTLPPPERARDVPGPRPRPNGLPCLVPGCDGTPYHNCELCPPHQRFSNAFERWLWYRDVDRDRERLTPRR